MGKRGRESSTEDILGLVVPSDEVVHDIGMSQTLLNLVGPAEVPFLPSTPPSAKLLIACDVPTRQTSRVRYTYHRSNLPEVPSDPQMPLLVLVAVRNDDLRSSLGYTFICQ